MLVDGNKVNEIIHSFGINVTGVLHIGAHNCEELQFYKDHLQISPENIVWVDAMEDKIRQNKERGIPNQYQAVISDVDDCDVNFNIANNGESSSIFEFGTHSVEHPHIRYVGQQKLKTKTIVSLYVENNLDVKKYNFWNLDIQGAELLALKGSRYIIDYVDAIYLEVNDKELYKGCAMFNELDEFLKSKGFVLVIKDVTRYGWGDALYCRNKN
jgi:FkbM family methyltransferase